MSTIGMLPSLYNKQRYSHTHTFTLSLSLMGWDFSQARHAAELQSYFNTLHQQMSRPKASPELLNLRRVEEVLARQKKYNEAKEVKVKADELEAQEIARYEAEKAERITKLTRRSVHRQRLELAAVDQRIRSGRAEQEKLRQLDMQRSV